jgi:hypothetical protein
MITGSHDNGNSVVTGMGTVYGKGITLEPFIFDTAKENVLIYKNVANEQHTT